MQFSFWENRVWHSAGHREYLGLGSPSTNEGNYLELIGLLAKNDTLLEQHLLQSN